MQEHHSEKGQTIVFIALAMVALFAFAGLAIDGGRVYAERRRAQNAADAAALAAVSAVVDGQDGVDAALSQTEFNAFTDNDPGENAANPVDVVVNNPPQQGQYAGEANYYEVIIRTTVTATFGRVIWLDDLPVEAVAVARVEDDSPFSGENAIHALDDSGYGIVFNGKVNVNVDGGNIFSNSGINKNGASGTIVVTDGEIFYTQGSTCNDCDKGVVSPTPKAAPHPISAPAIDTPSCGTTVGYQSGDSFYPGIYNSQIKINGKSAITFQPGIYCLQNGLHINGQAVVTAVDVLFVIEGGNFYLNGGSDSKFVRDNDVKDANGKQFGGLLVYVPPSNSGGEVSLLGNNGTKYMGTVYSPKGFCEVGGTADMIGVKANIICWNIKLHGNPTLDINYKANQNLRLAPVVELSE